MDAAAGWKVYWLADELCRIGAGKGGNREPLRHHRSIRQAAIPHAIRHDVDIVACGDLPTPAFSISAVAGDRRRERRSNFDGVRWLPDPLGLFGFTDPEHRCRPAMPCAGQATFRPRDGPCGAIPTYARPWRTDATPTAFRARAYSMQLQSGHRVEDPGPPRCRPDRNRLTFSPELPDHPSGPTAASRLGLTQPGRMTPRWFLTGSGCRRTTVFWDEKRRFRDPNAETRCGLACWPAIATLRSGIAGDRPTIRCVADGPGRIGHGHQAAA